MGYCCNYSFCNFWWWREIAETKEEVKEEKNAKTVDQEAFKAYAQNIMGRTFINAISVTENKGLIEFFGL